MKNFIPVLITCLLCCFAALFIFGLLFGNSAYLIVAMFALTILITILLSHSSRIRELEDSVKQLTERSRADLRTNGSK